MHYQLLIKITRSRAIKNIEESNGEVAVARSHLLYKVCILIRWLSVCQLPLLKSLSLPIGETNWFQTG